MTAAASAYPCSPPHRGRPLFSQGAQASEVAVGDAVGRLDLDRRAHAGFYALQTAVVLQGTAPELRGRTLDAVTLGIGSQPLGALTVGAPAEALWAPLAVAGMSGLGLVLVLAVSLALRVWRPPRPNGGASK